MKKKIILASCSPRRKDILEKMGLEFKVIPSDYDENLENFDFSYEKIENFAYNKAKSVFDKLKNHSPFTIHNSIIIGADTVVVLNKKILGKPKNEAEAMDMLTQLSGNKHSVVTSICIIDTLTSENKIISTTSYVEFSTLSEDLIKNYINHYRPFDKAGSYGIQELPEGFVKNIEGSFENIIGLCSDAVNKILNDFSYNHSNSNS